MKWWQPITVYVVALFALYGTKEVESVEKRKQTIDAFTPAKAGSSI